MEMRYLLGNCINFSIPDVDAEAFMLTTKDLISVSNGSACTSSTYEPSHVIKAMSNDDKIIKALFVFLGATLQILKFLLIKLKKDCKISFNENKLVIKNISNKRFNFYILLMTMKVRILK